MASERPVFILGCPGSGTTLLGSALGAHPRIAIAPETRFLLGAYEHRRAYGDLRDVSNRRALAEWIVAGAGTRFRDLGLDPHAVAAEIVAGPPTLGSAIGIVLRAYARCAGKPRWGDVRPGYVQHIDALTRLFPDAQIVHVIRDGRDCVASLKRAAWWRMGTYHAMATWAQAIDAGRAATRRLPADAYIETQYEHLTADAEGELRRLCGFLDETYVPEMTVSCARPSRPDGPARGGAEPQHDRADEWLGSGGTDRARELERWEIELCESVMAERLTSYGYRLTAARRPPAHHLARYRAVAAHRRLAACKRAFLDSGLRAAESQPVASRLGRAVGKVPASRIFEKT